MDTFLSGIVTAGAVALVGLVPRNNIPFIKAFNYGGRLDGIPFVWAKLEIFFGVMRQGFLANDGTIFTIRDDDPDGFDHDALCG